MKPSVLTLSVLPRALEVAGIDIRRAAKFAYRLPRFIQDAITYSRTAGRSGPDKDFELRIKNLRPLLHDRGETSGPISWQYFYQDIWAARRVFANAPALHLDIGSRLDGFVSHLLVFRDVSVVDIRPLPRDIPGVTFRQADATTLASIPTDSVESISSLHAIEHFGLGRYGDPVNPQAWRIVLQALERVLKPGGRLYLGVPIGQQRVMFNAHRIFAARSIIDALPKLQLVSFSYIDDEGRFHGDTRPGATGTLDNGCGLFELTK